MTKEECLQLLKLLSALESWSFAETGRRLPEYLSKELIGSIEVLEREILK